MPICKETEELARRLADMPKRLAYLGAKVKYHIAHPDERDAPKPVSIGSDVFEEYACIYLEEKYRKSGLILLSPGEIEETYDRYGLLRRGISVPDGLVLQRSSTGWKITSICDYKTGITFDRRQLMAYFYPNGLNKDLKLHLPGGNQKLGEVISDVRKGFPNRPVFAPPHPSFIYGVPSDSSLRLTEGKREEIPVPRRDLEDIAFAILSYFDPEYYAPPPTITIVRHEEAPSTQALISAWHQSSQTPIWASR